MDESIPVTRAVDLGTAKLLPDADCARAWLLTVDDVPQSYVDLDEPTELAFEYVRRLGHLLDVAVTSGEPLDALHLGGGGLTLPRYLAATRPGSRQWVVEADRELAELVAEVLPLPPTADVEVWVADAREALEAAPPASADVIVADVYGGNRVPATLTTVEYVQAAARVLRPGGLYLANVADGAPFAFLRGQLATLATVFPELCLVAEPAVLRGRRFGNAVLAASRAALPVADLARRAAADAFPARVEYGEGLARLWSGATPVVDLDAVPSPAPPAGAFQVGEARSAG